MELMELNVYPVWAMIRKKINEVIMKVLMAGPDRSVHGGISALVNSYYQAGLDTKVDLKYIGTMKEGSKIKKLLVAACAYLKFCAALPSYDIIHIHLASDNSFWRKSLFIKKARKLGKKIIIHQHGGDFKNYHDIQISPEKKAQMDNILNMADKLIVLTPSWKDYFSKIIDADRICVIPNGVVLPPDDRGVHDLHKILYLGRICTDKGIGELIDAVTALHKDDPAIELYLGGIFETRTDSDISIKKRVEENSDFIRYMGWVTGEAKENALNECGVVVLPSYFEGFGLIIIEAMSHGCIAIGSAVGGIPEIISDGTDGILVNPKDADDLARKMAGIINDPDRINMIKQNAYKKVSEYYSMDVVISGLMSVYNELVSS